MLPTFAHLWPEVSKAQMCVLATREKKVVFVVVVVLWILQTVITFQFPSESQNFILYVISCPQPRLNIRRVYDSRKQLYSYKDRVD